MDLNRKGQVRTPMTQAYMFGEQKGHKGEHKKKILAHTNQLRDSKLGPLTRWLLFAETIPTKNPDNDSLHLEAVPGSASCECL